MNSYNVYSSQISKFLIDISLYFVPTVAHCNSATKAATKEPAPAPKRPKNEVSYEELLELLEKEDILLIDVREPKEVEKTGLIPKSINVPCK